MEAAPVLLGRPSLHEGACKPYVYPQQCKLTCSLA